MLTVYGKYLYTLFLCRLHNKMARSYKSFLVGKSYVFTCFDGSKGRLYSYHSHYRGKHHLCTWFSGNLNETIHAMNYLYIHVRKFKLKIVSISLLRNRDNIWFKFSCLFFYKFYILTARKSNDVQIAICSYYVQGLGSDRTGRTYYGDIFHIIFLFLYSMNSSRKYIIGAVNIMLSNLSSTPPCPGISLP